MLGTSRASSASSRGTRERRGKDAFEPVNENGDMTQLLGYQGNREDAAIQRTGHRSRRADRAPGACTASRCDRSLTIRGLLLRGGRVLAECLLDRGPQAPARFALG